MTVSDHYEHHLAPIYVWMAGGAEAALQAGRSEIQELALPVGESSSVVDLGAGFGMHSIPIAQSGASVVAIDSSTYLLSTLKELCMGAPVRVVCDDLLRFAAHLTDRPNLILCMGDTITHLQSVNAVATLIENVSANLTSGGTFVISLRDYSVPFFGNQRFIPVRSDGTRILTCFLEFEPTSVLVHDMLHEKTADGWTLRVSHYRKLRLAISPLVAQLESLGFAVRRAPSARGLVRLIAVKR